MYLQANPRNVPLQTTCHPNIYLLGYRSICEPDFKKHQYLYQYSGKTNKQTKKAPNTPKIKNSRPIPLNDPAEHTSDSVCLVSWQSFPVLPEISRFHPKSHMKAILLCNIPMQYCSAAVFPDCHYITRAKEREPGPFIGPKKLKNIQLSSIKTLLRQKSWKPMSPHLPQIKAHFKTSISSNS